MSGYTDIAWLQYELEKLRAELAKKSAEIERLKTVPMMYRRMAFNAQLQAENNELHQQLAAKDEVIAEAGEMLAMRDRQLAALKAELREICAAIDDPACDLTLTTVECIKKLKAENEWRPIETAPKDNAVFLAWRKHATHPLMVRYEPSYDWFANYDGEHVYDLTHWMPLPKPPAMAKGEK